MSSPPSQRMSDSDKQMEESLALARLSRHRAIPVDTSSRRVGLRASALLRRFSKDEGPGLPLLQQRWKDLVGERLSKLSKPVKLTGKKEARVLTLEILPAASPIFQHQGEFLKQHLTAAIGGHIRDIKLVQKRMADPKAGKISTRPLTAQERDELKQGVSNIKNTKLSEALLAFGEAIYTQDR
ncbi:MAG: hypothetical protein CMK07_03260 [Ponticaulis sp.]|nr:hypothetical protein [Ponticaulis sp.]